ncbi:Ycf66 family protein [Gloeocapsa sp. PCC 73106]|uniref:Ycf66 family protein n=1 Tax=Gloeocapsa sp. PCC 73106 TaxID=102232 RepID=UPI0002AD0376|nr:Ycf66 family protein [Gloeocapsa sp. PCC 73106]ELR96686.1 Ycf66 protein [Gloeocapsa sp. PCC 73106]
MVNFGLNSASILGIFLAVAGAALYFIRSVRPELSRDHDIFFAAVGLLCGLILLFQGWRLDPILQFGQFLLTGSAIFFAVETMRLRASTAEQARRNSPIVDEERSVSRVYRAELDQIEGYDAEPPDDNPRLRGYVERPSTRRSNYDAEADRSSKSRRSSPRTTPSDSYYDAWENPSGVEPPQSQSRRSSSSRPRRPSSETPSRTRKKSSSRPGDQEYNYYSDYTEPSPSDYVDYQPIDPEQTLPQGETKPRPRKPNPEPPTNFDY